MSFAEAWMGYCELWKPTGKYTLAPQYYVEIERSPGPCLPASLTKIPLNFLQHHEQLAGPYFCFYNRCAVGIGAL